MVNMIEAMKSKQNECSDRHEIIHDELASTSNAQEIGESNRAFLGKEARPPKSGLLPWDMAMIAPHHSKWKVVKVTPSK